jgi:hypothetical protein
MHRAFLDGMHDAIHDINRAAPYETLQKPDGITADPSLDVEDVIWDAAADRN